LVPGWDLHPLESAALSRRTPVADYLLELRINNIWGAHAIPDEAPATRRTS
jgi:hypothetical protein